tara:strand:+ start:103 stop:828 length:726 start_codon:yes stop_codon:yes gene_type:complete
MNLKKLISTKGLIFLIIFSVVAFISQRLNFSSLVGAENQFFTLFQFIGPVAGGFLGPLVGVITVLIAEVVNFIALGKDWSIINLARLLPMLFAAYYFGTNKGKLNFKKYVGIVVPIIAIIAFVVHPVGRTVWFFSLYWLIPIIVRVLPQKFGDKLFLRSVGATFTAHAVGGALWIWTIPMPAEAWVGLIPVVALERLLFSAGIAGSYILFTTVLDKLDAKFTNGIVNIDLRYTLFKKILKI